MKLFTRTPYPTMTIGWIGILGLESKSVALLADLLQTIATPKDLLVNAMAKELPTAKCKAIGG